MGFKFETIESVSVALKKENEALRKENESLKAATSPKQKRATKSVKSSER